MPAPGLDMPPMPDPSITSQQGTPQAAPPGRGLGAIAAQRPGGQPAPGAPDPHGAVTTQVEAIKKVLEEMAKTEPMMAPFAARATAVLDSGLSAVRSSPQTSEGNAGDIGPGAQGNPPPQGRGGVGQGPPMA
jgi:hypothetical protein